ncbi:MAG: efflux RND transporter periplasmic adaptor subunit, partial [bacterium]
GANSILVSVISAGRFEIEANVPEADVAKLEIGDTARMTLDAYGDDIVFEARVSKIDPAETVIEGVATYKTTLQFVGGESRAKPGMTANIDILTDSRENVIVIPQRAVITKDGERFVRIETGEEEPEERPVQIGLRGFDGNVEIIEGLEEGEKVITFIRE